MLLFTCSTEDPQMITASPSSPARRKRRGSSKRYRCSRSPSDRENSCRGEAGRKISFGVWCDLSKPELLTRWQRRQRARIVKTFRLKHATRFKERFLLEAGTVRKGREGVVGAGGDALDEGKNNNENNNDNNNNHHNTTATTTTPRQQRPQQQKDATIIDSSDEGHGDLTAEARVVSHPPERSRHEVGPVLVAENLKLVDLVEQRLVPVPAPAHKGQTSTC